MRFISRSEQETESIAERLSKLLSSDDVVLFEGELGAGKTTLIRGILKALGHVGPVRSPTFNLIQTFDTVPPVMHADLYRVTSAQGIGLEDYFGNRLCLIEWPDRIGSLADGLHQVRVKIAMDADTRSILVEGLEAG